MYCSNCGNYSIILYQIDGKPVCSTCFKQLEFFELKDLPNGWQCPICGSVYSPFVQECHRCINSNIKYTTDNGTSNED
jgi:predicted amidophosphoribosyltransferase